MEQKKLKKLLNSYKGQIDYETSGSYFNPLPNKIILYIYNEGCSIDISLDENDVLRAEIYVFNDLIELTDRNISFIYNYFSKRLKRIIKESKEHYLNYYNYE